jgi:2-hydroxy-6-oxonona-2,4-dienedioate hydrolase
MRAQFVDVAGQSVRLLREGDGAPVLLLHPVGHCAELFMCNIDELARTHTVIAPDLPGHGFSDAVSFGACSPQSVTADVLFALMDALGFERFSLIGSSYGGLVAARMALRSPARVARLGIVGSASTFAANDKQEETLRAVMANASTAMKSPTLDACRRRLGNICHDARCVRDEIAMVQMTCYAQPDRLAAFVDTIDALIASSREPGERVHDQLGQLEMPVLVLVGRNDIRADWRVHESGARRIRHSELLIVEECGHLPFLEHPDLFNRTAARFLQA